jgi:site-specific DNA-cytosine methylase
MSIPQKQADDKVYRAIDLFAGIGSIRLGFHQAFKEKISFVYLNGHDSWACQTYRKNFGEIVTKKRGGKLPQRHGYKLYESF